GSSDTTIRLWDIASGRVIAVIVGGHDDANLVMMPVGFFAGGHDANKLLGLVRGLEVATVDQGHQSFFNPDLVRQAVAGDPSDEVKRAVAVITLEKVLDSGPAPEAEITSPAPGSTSDRDLLTVSARIKDRGKGIGRIEWRVNGITAGV